MAEISKPQDTKQPISPAVVGKVVQDNARTIADTAADTAVRRTAASEAVLATVRALSCTTFPTTAGLTGGHLQKPSR